MTGAVGSGRRIFARMTFLTVFRLLAIAALSPTLVNPAAGATKRQVVLELYTSQGCSTCPSADGLIGRLADRADLLALTLPITYWDMLGWKDTLASEANTHRQKSYAATMGRGGVYTPQIIVDGIADVVGSREGQLDAAINARRADIHEIPVALSVSSDAVHIEIGASPEKTADDATVWMFHVLGHASVRIGAGENKGRRVDYRNVVRDIRAVAIWRGSPLSLDVPRGDQGLPAYDSIAVLVQEGGYGRIIGARLIGPFDTRQR